MPNPKPTRYRRFLALFCTGLAINVLLLAGFNYIVDPYTVFHGQDGALIDKATRQYGKRPAKMNRLREGDWQVVVVGSSRAEVGIDPSLPASEGYRLYNAGLNGSGLVEITAAARYAIEHNPGLETLLVVLDPIYFSPHQQEAAVFPTGPHHADYNGFDRTIGHLLGMEATSASFRALWDYRSDEPLEVSPLGARIVSLNRGHTPYAVVFDKSLAEIQHEPEGMFEPARLRYLPEVLDAARGAGVEVVLMLSPSHARWWVHMERAGHWGDVERVKRELVAVVDEAGRADGPRVVLYDFARVTPETTVAVPPESSEDQTFPNYWDPVHFRAILGERMLRQALRGDTAETMGVELTPANLESHLAEERAALRRYRESLESAEAQRSAQ